MASSEDIRIEVSKEFTDLLKSVTQGLRSFRKWQKSVMLFCAAQVLFDLVVLVHLVTGAVK